VKAGKSDEFAKEGRKEASQSQLIPRSARAGLEENERQ